MGRRRACAAAARVVALVALVLATAGCVGPARTRTDYRRKVGTTVSAVRGSVQTALLALEATGRHHLPADYVSVMVGEAEDDAAAVQGTFASIQPPDASSDALRSRTLDLVGRAVDRLTTVRIAVRRGQFGHLADDLSALRRLATELDAFESAHGA